MITMERGKYYMGGKVEGLELPKRVFPCASPRGEQRELACLSASPPAGRRR